MLRSVPIGQTVSEWPSTRIRPLFFEPGSENSARMRVDRALDKLQVLLGRRGITSTTAALGVVLANPLLAAAPAGMAASVTEAALAGAHIATVPLKVLTQMIHHPLTDKGILQFRKDWEAAQTGSSATKAAEASSRG